MLQSSYNQLHQTYLPPTIHKPKHNLHQHNSDPHNPHCSANLRGAAIKPIRPDENVRAAREMRLSVLFGGLPRSLHAAVGFRREIDQ